MKTKKRFKHWLIHKLGGYTMPNEQPPFVIEHSVLPLISLNAQVKERRHDANKWQEHRDMEHAQYIVDALADRLAEQIKEHIDITICDNEWEDMRIYHGEIKIAKRR